MFVHEDRDFDDLLRIVADEHGLAVGLVEKDYWVTHALWALLHQGFDTWFKGGTSLSKGFGLIERFSEDLDLKVSPGRVVALPEVSDWTREGARVTAERRLYFEALATMLEVPGGEPSLDEALADRSWRSAGIRVTYPGQHLHDLGLLRPFVLLEVGSARVTPYVERDLSSFVHDTLEREGQLAAFEDNRPREVRCVHPLVTLIEKLDALHRRVPREDLDAATFVRHFEDAARIIAAVPSLPPLDSYADTAALTDEMRSEGQIRQTPSAEDAAFLPGDDERWAQIRDAYRAIEPMYWGKRVALEDACASIREWVSTELMNPER
jgi:hypothetical protein